MGETNFVAWPVALYGIVLVGAGVAYYILSSSLVALHGSDSLLAAAVGRDVKGKVSAVLPVLAVPLAFVSPWISCALYALLALVWLVPDRRIETTLGGRGAGDG